MLRSPLSRLAVLPVLLLAACTADSVIAPSGMTPSSAVSNLTGDATFIIDLTGTDAPSTLAADVAAAGGTLTSSLDGVGLAFATSADPAFALNAANIAGVRAVMPDLMVQWVEPAEEMSIDVDALAGPDLAEQGHAIGGHETFRRMQYNVDAVSAPAAWAAGYQGAGARVAVIDGAVHSRHIDLVGNLDVARSRSFVPGTAYNQDGGTFWHGTHVAGIVAAAANNIGTVGVAPKATIIGVKALHNGSGAFSWIINAIVYSATPIAEGGAGAHIINMSLGARFQSNAPFAVKLKNALSKATTYAYQRGTTVIAAAGNNATDLDHTNNLIFVPAQSTHVIAVAATGSMGFALGATNFDRPAAYTNFGQSVITLAGPGGDSRLPGTAFCTMPVIPSGGIRFPCWVFDMIVSTSRGGALSISSYSWAAGTSMAAPAAAGVAALIVGKNGGPMHPAQVEAKLRESADDLGKPGNDDFYGRGRVNALRAIQ